MAARTDSANLLLTINGAAAGNTLRDLQKQATDLRRKLDKLPVDSAEWKKTAAELQKVNTEIKTARDQTKAISTSLDDVNAKTSFWGKTLQIAVGVLGGLSLENILQSLAAYGQKLFGLGVAQDSMASKTATVFGAAERIVRDFAAKTAQSIGLAKSEFVNLATNVGDLLVPMGFSQEAAAHLSNELVRMGGVLSEWSNGKFTTAEATEILQKALLGERDALNSLGIDIKQELIDAELKLRNQDKLTGAAKRQAESLITLQLITEQSSAANTRFEATTDSLVRKKAEFKAKIAELTVGLSSGLIPAFQSLLSIGLGVLNFLIAVGRVLLGIPKFVYDNRVAFGLLTVGLVTLNWQLVVFNARVLLMQGALAIGAARTALMTAAQWALNGAMSANPIGLIITAMGILAIGISEAYKRSETFRAVLAGLGAVAVATFNLIKAAFLAFVGDYAGAAQAYEKGKKIGTAYSDGYNESIRENRENREKALLEDRAAEERDRAAYEAERGKKQGDREKKTREQLDAERKKALEAAEKVLEKHAAQRELELEKHRVRENLSEKEFQLAQLEIKKAGLEEQLALFRRFKGAESTEALKTQKEILENERAIQLAKATLPKKAATNEFGQAADDIAALDKDKNEERREIRLDYLATEDHDFSEAAQKRYADEERGAEARKKLDDDETAHKKENAEKLARQRQSQISTSAGILGDFFNLQQEFFSKDEASRKKNSEKIKRAQRAEVVVAGIAEVQKLFAGYASLPIIGQILAAAQAALAVGRTVVAIRKINQQTFAGGGFTGSGTSFRDHTGHSPVGVVHQNEWVAPEWMTQHPTWGRYIGAFENVRQRGFADGGFATTPVFGSLPPAQNDFALMAMLEENRAMRRDINQWQRALRVSVIYSDIESAGSTLTSIRSDAAI